MPYPDRKTEKAIRQVRRMLAILRMESPIETKIYPALLALAEPRGCYVLPQYKLKRFRYDFAICVLYSLPRRVVALVECDGKAFHQTPIQRRRDRRKDEIARQERLPLFRFSGSQINADPFKCVEQIADTWQRWS